MGEVINAFNGIRGDDIIIAFMGPTGAGKSFFIDLLTGQAGRRAGDSLASVTADIQATRVKHHKYGDRIVLVDTPGFDDTTRTDMEILSMISKWLEKTYRSSVKLSGLIYLHRISDNRMAGTPYKNLRMFGELCGDTAMNHVILVSTMWGRVKADIGNQREQQLKENFWKPLIDKGSRVDRLKQPPNERDWPAEAWRVVGQLVSESQKRDAVLLQEELVNLELKLNETEAGKTLYTSLQKLLADQKESLKSLLAQLEKSDSDPKLKKELEKEYKKIQSQFQKTFEEAKRMKVPIGRRIMMIFFGKKARAKAVKLAPEVK